MAKERNQAGIALGTLFGMIHALWVLAVSEGLGQPIIHILESWHFLSSNYTTTSLDPVTAISGIIGAAVSGYIIGWIFIYIYNLADRKFN